jgi:dienelactone hydrolase
VSKSLQLKASDGHSFNVYCAEPAGTPRGAIVLIQEIFGVNSHILQLADGYAVDGYLVLAPALFDRVERDVEIGYSPEDIKRGYALMGKLDIDNVLMDVAATIKEASNAGKVAIVGYCWGGYVSWMAAAKLKGLACSVVYYGQSYFTLARKICIFHLKASKSSRQPTQNSRCIPTMLTMDSIATNAVPTTPPLQNLRVNVRWISSGSILDKREDIRKNQAI